MDLFDKLKDSILLSYDVIPSAVTVVDNIQRASLSTVGD